MVQAVFLCTNSDCEQLFVAYYTTVVDGAFAIAYISKGNHKQIDLSDIVISISPNFKLIYEQSYFAEEEKLMEICGVGYRKSLEFLIKDYLIYLEPVKKDIFEKKWLGSCIEDDIKSDNIKAVAKRAVWLGNDETHYMRIWKDKDLKDLKNLIGLTIKWIETEEMTKEAIKDMPEKQEYK